MISSNHPIPDRASLDRESLSALFDGELHGDASRFAMKRLSQDVQWRQSCSTWQLAGDVLRGQAMAAAPADFAGRIQLSLSREAATQRAETSITTAPGGRAFWRRGWVGGAALAASVVAAALLVNRPLDDAAPAGTSLSPQVAAAAGSGLATPEDLSQPASPMLAMSQPSIRQPAINQPVINQPGISQSVQPSPVGRGSARTARPVAVAVAVSIPGGASSRAARPASVASTAVEIDAAALAVPVLAHPFQLPTPVAAKPWPRAVLPGYPVAGAMTASYGGQVAATGPDRSADAPTFFPFEPRLPPDVEVPASNPQSR